MRRSSGLLLLLVAIFYAQQVQAWNDLGHMTVARIAYERLSEHERDAVCGMLRFHPHLHEILLQDRPKHVSDDEWIFLRAAVWPDHIRPPRKSSREPIEAHPVYRFHHASWHYVNFEYHPGQRETELPHQPLPHHATSHPSDRTDILEQLDRSYMIVRGAERERSEPEITLSPAEIRAVRVCWLFHLIGDIHQPLHVVALVDNRIPALQHGDEGGNRLAVRLNHANAPRKLHAIWDDLLGTHASYDKVVHLAQTFTRDPRLDVTRMPEFTQHKQSWQFAEESYRIAKDSIYDNGRLHYALWSRVESHELSANDVPVLPQQMIDRAHSIAIKQVTLAGHRLAERLRYIVSRDVANGIAGGGSAKPTRQNQPAWRSIR